MTQVGIYYDVDGEVVPVVEGSVSKHGSLDQHQTAKTTGGTKDGAEDTDYEMDQRRD